MLFALMVQIISI